MAAPKSTQFWSFDVSSLMVLVGESEEQKYRLARRSFLESVAAAPVSGLQTYLRSYEFLLDPGRFQYFSPYGCKQAPLRNMQLENAIRQKRLLEDQRYTYFQIPAQGKNPSNDYLLLCWVFITWLVFAGIVIFCIMAPWTTWIGVATCCTLSLWSITLRLVECAMVVVSAGGDPSEVAIPNSIDAIFILGRGASGFVLEGSRRDIKSWTSYGLVYRDQLCSGISKACCQWFTRVGTMVVVLFLFSTVPNGSTIDQVAFILLNILGQLNTLIGLRLNARHCLSRLKILEQHVGVRNRTIIYGFIMRKFKHLEDKTWIDKAGLTPNTKVWMQWREEVVKDNEQDPKQLYNQLASAQSEEKTARVETYYSKL